MSDPGCGGYEWTPTEIAAWRLWADNQPDSITRNKIHALLDSYVDREEIVTGKEEAQHLAIAALDIVKELTPIIRHGCRKGAGDTKEDAATKRQEAEDLIKELIDAMLMIQKWDFKGEQKETTLTLDNRPKV